MRDTYLKPIITLTLASAFLIGCGGSDNDDDDDDNTQEITRAQDSRTFSVDEAGLPFDPVAGYENTDRWYGTLDGAGYRVEVPENWNGMLVMYAHGYRGEGPNLTVDNPGIREWLLENGYAWAASSYSRNYYDVRAGIEDTNKLALNFVDIAAENGRTLHQPYKTYITGVSMGGHITAAAIEAETYATANNVVHYDGAVPMCGVVGGTYEFDYLLNFTMAAHELAGNASTSDNLEPPQQFPASGFETDAINAQLWSDQAPDYDPANGIYQSGGTLTEAGEDLRSIVRRLSGGDRPYFDIGFSSFYFDIVMGTGGRDGTVNGILARDLSGNTGVTYHFDGDPALTAEEIAFNTGILRVAADPAANPMRSDGLRWIPKVNGEFSIPVVTIHGLGDLYVPFIHEQIYRQRAAANGSDQWLVQRAIRAPGHCDFSDAEQENAFAAMINWEQNGIRPEGDEVLDASVIADPNYGCQFTTPERQGLPACAQ
ncbi:alpha/beta hydrolase [Ectothiorhodospiraceae bacterium WFHF3C12]|nr:alpha/beta hydrolase [Ectothiorhodospiraceae bacterium WFHF3C12]